MIKAKTALSIFFLITFASYNLFSLEWPLDNFTFSMLFGDAYSKDGDFQAGLVLKGDDGVKAAEYGKKLISIEETNRLNVFPSTLGNALVISHDKGLQTIYGGLKDAITITDASSQAETFSIIGTVGNTAWGREKELTFQVLDTQEKTLINPTRHLLPLLPFQDKLLPTITGTILTNPENGQTYRLDATKTVKQGEYDIYTFAFDSMLDSSEHFMPFEVSILINGKTTLSVQFYVLESLKGRLFLKKTKISANKLYNTEGQIYLGRASLKRGFAEIVILATDISQNTTKASYDIQVD